MAVSTFVVRVNTDPLRALHARAADGTREHRSWGERLTWYLEAQLPFHKLISIAYDDVEV